MGTSVGTRYMETLVHIHQLPRTCIEFRYLNFTITKPLHSSTGYPGTYLSAQISQHSCGASICSISNPFNSG